ncbi:MAG TPA: DUF3391 domain-containing protein, partial [Burkholderiaceae bacterium]|nr:DUF3391 domain-containing protein [Burkholderiaceae bacterium]
MSATIDVRELQVGMFVHLDLGWMAHPFPLGSFRISSTEQIEKIRSLGLQRVRWSPEKSELRRPSESQSPEPSSERPEPPAVDKTDATPQSADTQSDARRKVLSQHRAAQFQCERQYVQATREWRRMSDKVSSDPAAAREAAASLSQALLDKMLVDRDLSIRVLADPAGDRSAAHAMNVTILSLLLGRVFGLARADMMELGLGAMLHDIGKIDLADRLRFPDHDFSHAEHAAYREHVACGVRHGRAMGLPPAALLVIAQHHEQCDGSGFPQKRTIDSMSAAARILSLVNRYDNLCNPLLLSNALTPHEALSLLFAQGRQKFDV